MTGVGRVGVGYRFEQERRKGFGFFGGEKFESTYPGGAAEIPDS